MTAKRAVGARKAVIGSGRTKVCGPDGPASSATLGAVIFSAAIAEDRQAETVKIESEIACAIMSIIGFILCLFLEKFGDVLDFLATGFVAGR